MLPTLSRLSVSNGPESRLRHRYSSRYLRISPLHREFCSPLSHSSLPVSKAIPRLSRGISLPTEQAAYTRFTPSNSEQRLPPTFYRGCWHVVAGASSVGTVTAPGYWPGLASSQLTGFYDPKAFVTHAASLGQALPIAQNSSLLPPVGVWPVSQCQCGRSPSQAGYPSRAW